MPVDISSHYPRPDRSVNVERLHRFTTWLLHQLGRADHTVSLLLVDDEEMSWLNQQYRDKTGPTNVLSFPMSDPDDGALSSIPVKELGDVIISIDTARRESLELSQSLEFRMNWLIIHGILHLLGYDHERSEEDAELMFAKEQELLNKAEFNRRKAMTHLAINVDHIATIRQARGTSEPDPVAAAAICELAGAAGIVIHLREDRRHIQDRDVHVLRQTVKTKLNLEMGATKEMIGIARDVLPDLVTLVPEKRQELTTEGGLDVIGQKKKIAKAIEKLAQKQIPVSIFVDPDPEQIAASHDIGATFVEIHTGRYCDAENESLQETEYQEIVEAAQEAYHMGLRVNAGHGLDYRNTSRIAALDTIEELSIGHAVISRAVLVGLDQAVREMLEIVKSSQRMF